MMLPTKLAPSLSSLSLLPLLLALPLLAACSSSGDGDKASKPADTTPAGNIGAGSNPAQAGRSAAPSVAEWNGAPEVTVRGSSALSCSTQALREWLRVSCRGKNDTGGTPTNVTVSSANNKQEVLTFAAGGVSSLVMPFVEGADVTATFSWTDKSHTFKSKWPRGAPKPAAYGEFVGAATPGAKPAGAAGDSCRTHADCPAFQFCVRDDNDKPPLRCRQVPGSDLCKTDKDCVGNRLGPKCVGQSSGNVPMCDK